jgi:hypothetical protein
MCSDGHESQTELFGCANGVAVRGVSWILSGKFCKRKPKRVEVSRGLKQEEKWEAGKQTFSTTLKVQWTRPEETVL